MSSKLLSGILLETVLFIVKADATNWFHVMDLEKQLIMAVQKETMKLANSALTLTF